MTDLNLNTCSWDEAWNSLPWDASEAAYDALINADGTDSWRAKLAAARKPARIVRVSLTSAQSDAIEYLTTEEQLESLDLGATYLRGTVKQLEGVRDMLDGDLMWNARLEGLIVDLNDGLLESMERSTRKMVRTIESKINRAMN
tara:strand:+ start:1868 stop:2299 length:432 start_codon:yes stop_codon:yes gene_type:complete